MNPELFNVGPEEDKFSAVVVDHVTGKAAKAEPITAGDDLAAAKSQNEATAKARVSLSAAVSEAVKANARFHAVSVFSSMRMGTRLQRSRFTRVRSGRP